MTQQLLEMPNRCAGPDHVRGATVAERVGGNGFVDAGLSGVLAHDVPNPGWLHAAAKPVQEQVGGLLCSRPAWSRLGYVAVDQATDMAPDWHHAVLAVLALPHDQVAAASVQVV